MLKAELERNQVHTCIRDISVCHTCNCTFVLYVAIYDDVDDDLLSCKKCLITFVSS